MLMSVSLGNILGAGGKAGFGFLQPPFGGRAPQHERDRRKRLRHRNRAGGASKVAGSLTGTVKASWQLAATFVRIATEIQ